MLPLIALVACPAPGPSERPGNEEPPGGEESPDSGGADSEGNGAWTAPPFSFAGLRDTGDDGEWSFGDDLLIGTKHKAYTGAEIIETDGGLITGAHAGGVYSWSGPISGRHVLAEEATPQLYEDYGAIARIYEWGDHHVLRGGDIIGVDPEDGAELVIVEKVLSIDFVVGDVFAADGVPDHVWNDYGCWDLGYGQVNILDGTVRGAVPLDEFSVEVRTTEAPQFACGLAEPADYDGDGADDLVVQGAGDAFVFHGPISAGLLRSDADGVIEPWHNSITTLRDWNGDGLADVALSISGSGDDHVQLFSLAAGSEWTDADAMTSYVCNPGGDGYAGGDIWSVAVGDPETSEFAVEIHVSGAAAPNYLWVTEVALGGTRDCADTGALIEVTGFSPRMATATDLDQDGAGELAVGTWLHDPDHTSYGAVALIPTTILDEAWR